MLGSTAKTMTTKSESEEDRKVPTWDGNPSNWRSFETSAKWYVAGLKPDDRKLAAARIIGKFTRSRNTALRTLVKTLEPDAFEHPDGVKELLIMLKSSPLGKLPIPDAAHKIKYFYKH